jgi:Mrp family chromosome partitioning ATPase
MVNPTENQNPSDDLGAFLVLRTTVESEIPTPGILAVSSALPRDGKTGLVNGLVRALSAAGYATLAVDAAAASPAQLALDVVRERLADLARPLGPRCDSLVLGSQNARSASVAAIEALYAQIRTRYDYAVVDAGVLAAGGLAFARCADGVVLALRQGRSVAPADRDAVEIVERMRVRCLGVVATREQSPKHRPPAARGATAVRPALVTE